MYKRLSIRRLCLIIGLIIATAIAVSLGASFRAEADGSSSLGVSSVAYYPFSSDTDGTFRVELGQDDVTTIVQDKTYESYPNSSGDAMESATYYRPAIIVSGDRSSFSDVSTTSLTARKTKYGEDYIIIGNTSDKTEQTDFRYSCPFTFQEIADGNWARAFGNKLAMSFGVVKPFKTNLWESTYDKTYYFQAAIICIKAERYTYYPHKAGKVTYSISKLGTLDCFAYNYKKDCEQRLKECNENSGDSIVNSYYRVLGLTDVKDNMPITVKYKTMKDYGEYVEKTATFTVPKSIFLNSAKVEEYMYAARIKKKTVAQTDYYFESLADFNVNFIDSNGLINGEERNLSERIVMQALSCDYSYNLDSQTGTISINYSPFYYKDFFIKLTNNASVNEDNLTMYLYTVSVVPGAEKTQLFFDFSTIEGYLSNNCHWAVTLKASDFSVSGEKSGITSVEISDEARNLIVTFKNSEESALATLKVLAIAEIEEDTQLDLYLKYKALVYDGKNFSMQDKTAFIEKDWGIQIRGRYSSFDNVMAKLGNEYIYPALEVAALGDVDYYKPVGSTFDWDTDDETRVNLVMKYEHDTVFYIVDDLSGKGYFKNYLNGEVSCRGDYFDITVPTNYRIDYIESEFARVTGDKYYPLEQRFEFSPTKVAAQQDGIITVHYALTDSWHVVINYLETLGTLQESAPFARRCTYDGLLSVSKVADIKSITEKQIAELLGRESGNMNVLASRVEKVDVAFDNKATFTINLKYTFVSLKTMDDSGRAKEVQVPLTTYKQWVENMGTNWSILMLNRENRQYFKYSDEVAPSDLYGYFTCAVFEEKVSDLNYIFAKTSGAGTITVFSDTQAKVTSSYLYKKLSNVFNDTNNVFIKVATYPLLSFCELLNDDNSQVFSYYMYVDNTTDMPWFGRNGATSREDEDPAVKNWLDETVSNIKENKKVQYVFWVVVGALIYLLLTWIATKTGLLSGKSWFTWVWLGITVILLIVAFIYGYVIIIKG